MNRFDLETGVLAARGFLERKGVISYVSEGDIEEVVREIVEAVDKNREYHSKNVRLEVSKVR